MSQDAEAETVARVLALAARYHLEELEVEEGGLRIILRAAPLPEGAEGGPGPNGGRYHLWAPPSWLEPAAGTEGRPGRSETARPLLAPLTGIFYRAEKPDMDPYVEAGQAVEEGGRVGLIEAMKVFSEVTAEFAGTVVEIAAQNGQLVQHGDVLMYLEPAPSA